MDPHPETYQRQDVRSRLTVRLPAISGCPYQANAATCAGFHAGASALLTACDVLPEEPALIVAQIVVNPRPFEAGRSGLLRALRIMTKKSAGAWCCNTSDLKSLAIAAGLYTLMWISKNVMIRITPYKFVTFEYTITAGTQRLRVFQ